MPLLRIWIFKWEFIMEVIQVIAGIIFVAYCVVMVLSDKEK